MNLYQELITLTKLSLLELPKGTLFEVDDAMRAFYKSAIKEPVPEKIVKTAPIKAVIPPVVAVKREEPVKEEVKKVKVMETLVVKEPPKEIAAAPVLTTKKFQLEPLTKIESLDVSPFFSIVKEKASFVEIVDHYPLAFEKKVTEVVLTEVLILSWKESAKETLFLQNVARVLTKASVISSIQMEEEGHWDMILQSPIVKLIIVNDQALHALPGLFQHYREVHKGSKLFLGKVALFLLPEISLYFKEPLLKKSLYNSLRATSFL